MGAAASGLQQAGRESGIALPPIHSPLSSAVPSTKTAPPASLTGRARRRCPSCGPCVGCSRPLGRADFFQMAVSFSVRNLQSTIWCCHRLSKFTQLNKAIWKVPSALDARLVHSFDSPSGLQTPQPRPTSSGKPVPAECRLLQRWDGRASNIGRRKGQSWDGN